MATRHQLRVSLDAVILTSSSRPPQYIPVSFVHGDSVTKHNKLVLGFWELLLAEELGSPPTFGKIVHGSRYTIRRVQLAKLANLAEEIVRRLRDIKCGKQVPPLRLNSHCAICEFKSDCHETGVERNDLSLLRELTEKQIAKLNNKGIFAITQYSHSFRPRKTRKNTGKQGPKHDHSLQALALRTQNIHVVERSEFPVKTCRLFFDVESIPDEDFYYLIGHQRLNAKLATFFPPGTIGYYQSISAQRLLFTTALLKISIWHSWRSRLKVAFIYLLNILAIGKIIFSLRVTLHHQYVFFTKITNINDIVIKQW
jgi:predicted RecB family nuclease